MLGNGYSVFHDLRSPKIWTQRVWLPLRPVFKTRLTQINVCPPKIDREAYANFVRAKNGVRKDASLSPTEKFSDLGVPSGLYLSLEQICNSSYPVLQNQSKHIMSFSYIRKHNMFSLI